MRNSPAASCRRPNSVARAAHLSSVAAGLVRPKTAATGDLPGQGAGAADAGAVADRVPDSAPDAGALSAKLTAGDAASRAAPGVSGAGADRRLDADAPTTTPSPGESPPHSATNDGCSTTHRAPTPDHSRATDDSPLRPLSSWGADGWQPAGPATPSIPEEAAVAIVIDGSSQAVLMATPHELDDFALGFALTEGLIAAPADVVQAETAPVASPTAFPGLPAFETRLWLRPGLGAKLADRRRSMVGPVGCGLCGVDSIAAALPQVVPVQSPLRLSPRDVLAAMQALSAGQRRWRDTPAIHAAAFWSPDAALVREDVGRHNALDKLAGAMARSDLTGGAGVVAMTSRLSVDLVQKTARIGAPVLIGAGVPTRLATAWADAAGITLIGRARGDSFDIFTHPDRIQD